MATHYEFIDRQKIRKVQQKKNTFQYLPNFFWQFLALFPLSEIVNDFILFFQPQSPWKHRRLYKHEPLRPGATFPGGLVPTIRLQLDEIPEDCVTHFYLTENNGHVTVCSRSRCVTWKHRQRLRMGQWRPSTKFHWARGKVAKWRDISMATSWRRKGVLFFIESLRHVT